ncbi:MAG: MATE family efflux transporter [Bauldia sp.]
MNRALVTQPLPAAGWAAEFRATLGLAAPLILTNLAQMAFGATDVVMMGWLGPDALAAGALAVNVNFVLVIFGMGIAGAVAPMIARERGRNRFAVREVRRTVRQGLWSVLLIALPVMVVLWHGEAVLLALHQDAALAKAAGAYLETFAWSVPAFLGYLVLRSFVAALERPAVALVVTGLGILLNALAVYVLMFGRLGFPAMGLAGAGIGTTIASTCLLLGLALAIRLDRRLRRYRIFGHFWHADWRRFAELWRLGAPIGLTMWFEVSVFNAAVFLIGTIGAAALAAHQIVITMASLTFMVPFGFSQAASVRVGLAYGAGDNTAIARAGWTAFASAEAFMAAMALLMLLAPRLLIGVFLAPDAPENAEAVALAGGYLVFAALFQLADGAQSVGAGMLRGLHDTRVPMLFALVGYWGLGLPLGTLLAFRAGWAGAGIWAGLAAGLAIVAVLMVTRWTMRERLGLAGAGGQFGLPPPV